jgi:integrase/recombinase XerD
MSSRTETAAVPQETAKAAPPHAPAWSASEAPSIPAAPPAPRRGSKPSPLWRRPAAVQLNAPSQELQELKDRYLAWMIATRYAEDTIQHAHTSAEWLFKYLGMQGVSRVADVTSEVLDGYSLWLRERPNAYHNGKLIGTRTIIYRLTGVKQFFKWLTQNMIVLYDPAENLEVPQLSNNSLPQTILTQEEARKLLDAPDLGSPVGYRDKALLEVVYATGIRTREMFRLKVSDFDAKALTLFVREGKGGKDRVLPLPSIVAGYLKEYVEKVRPRFVAIARKDNGILFLSWRGRELDMGRLCGLFKKNAQAAGITKRTTPMILRHSIASHLLENGMDIRYIQEFLGHERISTTQIYAKVTLSGLRAHYNKHHPKEKRDRSRKQILVEKLL